MPPKEAALPSWNLSDIYRNENDPLITRTISGCKLAAKKFSLQYRGKLLKLSAQPQRLLKAIRQFEQIYLNSAKPVMFASLKFSESSTVPGRGAFLQKMRTEHVTIDKELMFFELELLSLGTSRLAKLAKHTVLKPYRHYLEKLLAREKHVLSEELEQFCSDLNLTGHSAFVRLFTEEMSALRLFPKLSGNVIPPEGLPSERTLELLYHPKRAVRKAGAEALSAGLEKESRRLSYISNTLIENKRIEDGYRKYQSPEEPRHLSNEISQEMVDAMSDTVISHYHLIQDFYRFKKKLLKVPTLYDYDRYAPVGSAKIHIPYKDAQDLVLTSFKNFSPEFEQIARQFFDKNWIDADYRPGKRGGGFCAFLTPDLHPYILVNYAPGFRETFTLAHELGHGIHAYLLRTQSYLNFDVPLTIAETASIFAEMLLFEQFKKRIKNKSELLTIYVKRLEGMFGSTFRQISMYKFEQDFHAARRKGEVSAEEIGKIWRKRQSELYGKSVVLTPGFNHWWSYIPHFIHTPFYVYAYAFGELLTLALFELYQEQGSPFVPTYAAFLKAGGTKSPEESLAPFKVNLRDPAFWRRGMKVLERLINEAKELA